MRMASKTWYLSTVEDATESARADGILDEGPADERIAGYDCYSCNFPLGFKCKIRKGDFIINRHEDSKDVAVWPAAEVWHVETIGKRRWIFTAHPVGNDKRTMTWTAFRKLAKGSGMKPFTAPHYSRTVPPDVATRIGDNWPSRGGRR